MRWTRVAFILLWAGVILVLVLWLYPFVQPVFESFPRDGNLLSALTMHSYVVEQEHNPVRGPLPWILLGIAAAMWLLSWFEEKK
jgi:type II secretory pathway component PulM